jgi:hypothetical protein
MNRGATASKILIVMVELTIRILLVRRTRVENIHVHCITALTAELVENCFNMMPTRRYVQIC